MKSRVLARVDHLHYTSIATAYYRTGVLAVARRTFEARAINALRSNVAAILQRDGLAYITQAQTDGDPSRPLCPEAAIRLPIDLWVCKLFDQTCPTQGIVLLHDEARFNNLCLASMARKQGILEAIRSSKYKGFHHVPARYLCVICDARKGPQSPFSYHYPWELAPPERFVSLNFERDWPRLQQTFLKNNLPSAAGYHPLCAPHAIELAGIVNPAIARRLAILDFEIFRPA